MGKSTRANTGMPTGRAWAARCLLGAAAAVPAIAIGAPLAAAQPAADPSASAAPPASHAEARPCVTGDFKIIENDRKAAAGTTYIEFAMIRIGGDGDPQNEPCDLSRRVGTHWIDEYNGDRVGSWAEYGDGTDRPSFVVAPGGQALLTVAQPDPANHDPADCDPRDVAGIQVYLEFEGDGGTYAPTGGRDEMCAVEGAAVPRVTVEEWPY
ncbi:hypothetical protein CLV63_11879 [Murinocardiopsis flavida]|uniref:DUF4232 domain-containing protein n=1 Tax=Murinocardiopsis flavida TaxID=645275 RepID=A0A2P8D536_9ACTN|nr:hypothetical protein [Murinocardiopsis flavida]PSK92320.1 hypothetical protein CLV63_11879 [Murinocardiopsis flavida]